VDPCIRQTQDLSAYYQLLLGAKQRLSSHCSILLLIKIQKQRENFSNSTAHLLCYSPTLGQHWTRPRARFYCIQTRERGWRTNTKWWTLLLCLFRMSKKVYTQWMNFSDERKELIIGVSATQKSHHGVKKMFASVVDESF
jgi:hypothetical protein